MVIELLFHAIRKTKISPKKLMPTSVEETHPGTKKIIFAYLIDVYVAYTAALLCLSLMSMSSSRLMVSATLEQAHSSMSLGPVVTILFPFFLTGYFFFCYFFNQGQTLGQKYCKIRVSIPEHSFELSLRWALASTFVVFSFGLTLSRIRLHMSVMGHGAYRTHDYLWAALLLPREVAPVNLVKLTEEFAVQEAAEEFNEAA